MYHNGYSVRIIGGDEKNDGYVALPHNTKYKLSLRNDKDGPCDAEVHVDGKHVGTWRIGARESIALERPSDDHGCFTFLAAGTPEGDAAGLVKGDANLGLISVVFKPGTVVEVKPLKVATRVEHHHHYHDYWPYYPYGKPWITWTSVSGGNWSATATGTACNTDVSYSAGSTAVQAGALAPGGTGLTGHSCQEYGTVAPLHYDDAAAVTINLRLVASGHVAAVRPLQAVATPVPPPVG